jgi:hypothetical protein
VGLACLSRYSHLNLPLLEPVPVGDGCPLLVSAWSFRRTEFVDGSHPPDHPLRLSSRKVASCSRTPLIDAMRIDQFTFGSICIEGVTYDHDVVIDRGRIRERKKKQSNPFAVPSVTPRSPSKRTSPGNADAWWSGPGPTVPFP